MNSISIKPCMGITFKSTPTPETCKAYEEDPVLGFDDEYSKYIRDYVIRPRVSEAYEDTFHKYGGRMSEYELKKTMSTLLAKPKVVSESAMKDLTAYNAMRFGNNCYRGSTLVGKPEELAKLKKAGVQRVMDIYGYSNYAQDCKDAGLEYSAFFGRTSIFDEEAFKDKDLCLWSRKMDLEYRREGSKKDIAEKLKNYGQEFDRRKDEFVEELIEFVNTVNKGYVYVGCTCGTDRTNDALCLNSLFNPKFEGEGFQQASVPDYSLYNPLSNLYHNLTDEQKKRLGFTKDFEQRLVKRIDSLKYEQDYH